MVSWDPTNFKTLCNTTRLTASQLSEVLEISEGAIIKYKRGQMPRIEYLIKMADYFCVPLDFLVGRCSEETAKEILENYPECFMKCRRAAYEKYLEGGIPIFVNGSYESPWPYNFLDLVNSDSYREPKPIDWIVPDNKIDDIYFVLDTLKPREKELILLYFEKGLTYDEIGKTKHVSREVIRQVICRGIRKCRHPARRTVLLERHMTYTELRIFEDSLYDRERELNRREGELRDSVSKKVQLMGLENLDLRVRPFNCLVRSGLRTVQDVIKLIERSEEENKNLFSNIRGLGLQSYHEILEKLDALTGQEYSKRMKNFPYKQYRPDKAWANPVQ